MQAYRLLYYLIIGLLASYTCQGQKTTLYDIDRLIAAGGNDSVATLQLEAFVKGNPKNALAYYLLARQYEKNLRNTYIHVQKSLEKQSEFTRQAYGNAIGLVNNKELSRNKVLYQEKIGSRKLSPHTVRFVFEQSLEDFQQYWETLHRLQQLNGQIALLYQKSEQQYEQIVSGYQSRADLLFRSDTPLSDQLNTLQLSFDSLQHMVAAHGQITLLNDFSAHHQQFIFNPVTTFSLQKVPSQAFGYKKVLLLHYGDWSAQLLKSLRDTIAPLKQQLLEVDANLSANINRVSQMPPLPPVGDERMHNNLIYKLFQFDGHSMAGKLLMYKKAKADLLVRSNRTTSGGNLMEQGGNEQENLALENKLNECLALLANIDPSDYEIQKYREYVELVYNGPEGLSKFLSEEQLFLEERLNALVLATQKTRQEVAIFPAVKATAPQVPIRQNQSYLNHDSLLSFGNYVIKNSIPFAGQEVIAYGQCPGSNKHLKDAFIARMDSRNNISWMRKLMYQQQGTGLDSEITAILPGAEQQYFVLAKAYSGTYLRHHVLGLNAKGELLFDRPYQGNQSPRRLVLSGNGRQLVLLAKGQGRDDLADMMEDARITLYDRFGKIKAEQRLALRGTVTEILPWNDNGFVLVANFIAYQDPKGFLVASKAKDQEGFNVLLAFYDSQLNLLNLEPIFSPTPLLAMSAENNPVGRLVLKGLQGEYVFGGSQNVKGGQAWEYTRE
jgi:predicted small secreted protein